MVTVLGYGMATYIVAANTAAHTLRPARANDRVAGSPALYNISWEGLKKTGDLTHSISLVQAQNILGVDVVSTAPRYSITLFEVSPIRRFSPAAIIVQKPSKSLVLRIDWCCC